MNRPLARRAGPFLVALTALLLTAAGTVPRGQDVAAPRQAPWPTPALPDGRLLVSERPGGQLQRVVFNEKWEEIRREPLLHELKQRIRDVRQGPDGLLYVLTSENPGAVLRLEPVEATTT